MSKKPYAWQSLFALSYDLLLGGPEMFYTGSLRRRLIEPLSGLVLEIGAGTGISLEYYASRTRVIATEPDLASIERLASKAPGARAHVSAVAADAMLLPFPDGLFDGLVCNLALCTIPDPEKALTEAVRVLKPGAPARFMEHVRSGTRVWSSMQDGLAPMWRRVAGGCRLNQDSETLIREAGLSVESVETRMGMLLPVKLIWARRG